MDAAADNPPDNQLPQGVSDSDIETAVSASGYPLQTRVAATLIGRFAVQEEWSFKDRDSGQFRSLDIAASRSLPGTAGAQFVINPAVLLLIECKRSELPYLFFRSVTQPVVPDFPPIHGLRSSTIDLRNSQAQIRTYTSAQVLGLTEEPFIAKGPVLSATFTRMARKGKDFELSGSDPFNSVILPLVNSVDHSQNIHARHPKSGPFEATLVLPICVLDAPIVVADAENNKLELRPWVRVIRQETRAGQPPQPTHYAVDFVHVAFLDRWLDEWVLPFASVFAERVIRRPLLIHNMSGHVTDFDAWRWHEVKDPSGA